MKLMCDLLALGFQTDKDPRGHALPARDLSGLTHPLLGIRTAHHSAPHDGAIKTGRALDYLDKGDGNREPCSLDLSLMDGLTETRPLRRRRHAIARVLATTTCRRLA